MFLSQHLMWYKQIWWQSVTTFLLIWSEKSKKIPTLLMGDTYTRTHRLYLVLVLPHLLLLGVFIVYAVLLFSIFYTFIQNFPAKHKNLEKNKAKISRSCERVVFSVLMLIHGEHWWLIRELFRPWLLSLVTFF